MLKVLTTLNLTAPHFLNKDTQRLWFLHKHKVNNYRSHVLSDLFFWVYYRTAVHCLYESELYSKHFLKPLNLHFHRGRNMSVVPAEFLSPTFSEPPAPRPRVLVIAAGFDFPPPPSIQTHNYSFFFLLQLVLLARSRSRMGERDD